MQALRRERLHAPRLRYWCRELAERPRFHRKQWEFVFIAQSLWEQGVLAEGKRGLGFGVGSEPLPALFARRGCTVVATDQPARSGARAWSDIGQHAASLAALRHDDICDEGTLRERVTFRPVDMRRIPADLRGFDFTWSSCCFEHLGTLEAGLAFVEGSLECLAPGGISVHTTELNLSSGEHTLEYGVNVLYRRRDLEQLAARLTAAGHRVAPLSFTLGSGPHELCVDEPPFRDTPHVRLRFGRFVATSFGLVVQKGG